MRVSALASVIALALAGPALADGPIATAPAVGPAAPQPTAPAPALPDRAAMVDAQGAPMAMGPCGPEKVKPDGTLETTPHGEVDASVGSRGYRQIGGAVCQPVGQDGYVAASVSDGEYQGGRRH